MAKIVFCLAFIVLFCLVLSAMGGQNAGELEGNPSIPATPSTTGAESATDGEKNNTAQPITDTQNQIALNEYKFAVHLLEYFKGGLENICMSPYSIYRLLLVYMAASHQENRIHFQWANHIVSETEMKTVYNELKPSKISVVDRAFTNMDTIYYAKYFERFGIFKQIRVAEDSRKKRECINSEIAEATNEQITEIIKNKNAIVDSTELVLANVASFSSEWQTQFDPKTTMKRFYGVNGPIDVEMMTQTGKFKIGESKRMGSTVLIFPIDENIDVYIILPKGTAESNAERKMAFNAIADNFELKHTITYEEKTVYFELPKMLFDDSYELGEFLMENMNFVRNPILETAMKRDEKSSYYDGGKISIPKNLFAHATRMEFNQRGINVPKTGKDDNVEINTSPETDAKTASVTDAPVEDKIEVESDGNSEVEAKFSCDRPFLMVQWDKKWKQITHLSYYRSPPKPINT